MKPLIIFFDAPCVLCNFWIQKLCVWDRKDQLRFATLDHPLLKQFAAERGLDLNELDTAIVWDQTFSYALEAQGTFMILNRLGGLWKVLTLFNLLPKGITNGLYRIVARNRYQWFGKYDRCPLPDPRYQHKFL